MFNSPAFRMAKLHRDLAILSAIGLIQKVQALIRGCKNLESDLDLLCLPRYQDGTLGMNGLIGCSKLRTSLVNVS